MSEHILDGESFKTLITNPHSDEAKPFTIDVGWNKSFENLTFNSSITLERTEEYQHTIIFSNSTFQGINIDGSEFHEFVWFKNCVFEDDFNIYDGTFTTLIFDNCDFKKGFAIYNISIKTLSIDNSISKNPLIIKGGIFQKISYISHDEKTHLKIDGHYTFIEYFSLKTIIGSTTSISNCIVNLLEIQGDYNSSSRVNIQFIHNNEFSIKNLNNDGKFYLTNFNIEHSRVALSKDLDWYLEMITDNDIKEELSDILKYRPQIKNFFQLYNQISLKDEIKDYLRFVFRNTVFLTSYNEKPGFNIQYSSIGLFELKRMDLKKYNILVLSSDLSSIKLINTSFPIDVDAWTDLDGLSLYNDLYTCATKQNNTGDKIDYYKASQKFLLKKLYKDENSLHKVGSVIAIIVSKVYSNHGSNWIQALAVTVLAFGLPLFSLYCYSLDYISIDLSNSGFNYFCSELLPYFPQFINPLHRIDFMVSESPIGDWSGLVDLASRVFVGVGIFEMIRSFRKYVRT